MRPTAVAKVVSGVLLVITGIVCSGQPLSLSNDAAAQVISLTGQVSVLRDGEPWALNLGDKIRIQQVIVTGADGFAKFQVSDGSFFEVYPNSNVIFRKNPGNLRDLLDLIVGRVKIHIQKWGGQPNPNRIITPTAVISVRGTTFDVAVDDDDETTLVTVEEGIVDVSHALKPGNTRTLTTGESIQVYKNEPIARTTIDKNDLARRIVHAVGDAARVAIIQGRTPGIGTITHVPGGSGQTAPTPPPSVPPPPPSAPPPPPAH
ncbi:MAG TPA: FecR family protein [Bryobacteraceae bacterium]|nr:FecR family protein [Bryobacteraceae bacterium]